VSPGVTTLAVIAAPMLALWAVSLVKRDVSIVDAWWGPGFAVVAWSSLLAGGETTPARILVTVLVSVWALRLGAYLTYRNWGEPEDPRYQAIRRKVGPSFPIASLIIVFALQGTLMGIVSLPIQLARGGEPSVSIRLAPGIALWIIGFVFETVGDAQLARFKSDPRNRGQIMDRGLWRFTRHPNYFGDFLVWWGLFAIAWAAGAPAWTAIGPLVMSVLLLRVSGVTLLERTLRRRPGYDEYVRRTSAFFPRPPLVAKEDARRAPTK
jgi:steroid 5-alpha reductase family enzyme